MADTNSGVFTTPYGEQAAEVWYSYQAALTVKESAIADILVSGVTYAVTFNVSKGDLSGDFLAELVAFDPGDPRTEYQDGTVLASKSGQALSSDMSQRAGFSFTAGGADPSLGKLIGVRLGDRAFYDNVTLTDDMSGDAANPVLSSEYPADNQTTATIDYHLEMTFNEAVTNGTGNIVIKKTSDDSVVETIDVTSTNVVFDGTSLVTINPTNDLARGTAYYVQIDSTAVEDLAGNAYAGIADTTTWNFSTVVADGPNLIFADSFESPVVSGSKQKTAPSNWLRETAGSLSYWQQSGLANTNTGTFATPYGAQAATVWHSSQASLTTKEAAISDVVLPSTTYTVTFNVANGSDVTGAYKVDLVAFDPGDARDDHSYGTLLASVSGTASRSDMSAEADGFTVDIDGANAGIGKLLGLQIEGGGALVDNLRLTYVTSGTVFLFK